MHSIVSYLDRVRESGVFTYGMHGNFIKIDSSDFFKQFIDKKTSKSPFNPESHKHSFSRYMLDLLKQQT